ncbi:MAG: DUF4349 domain-containing protein, partial [Spirochaetales bacterium]|nr:DUF4349 domain-containing protein [Spirochaetales bacterium]
MKRIVLIILSVLLIGCEAVVLKTTIETPDGFAELDTVGVYAAVSPEGMNYRVRYVKNMPQQSLEFWTEALTTHLKQEGYVGVSYENKFNAQGLPGLFSEWTVPYNTDTHKYLTGILVTEEIIAVAEAAGDHIIYAQHRESILNSLETIQCEGVTAEEITKENLLSSTGKVTRSTTAVAQDSSRSSSSGCFLPDTPIITENGLVDIEDVWPGTMVSAYDPLSGTWMIEKVLRNVSLGYTGDIITIGIADQTIEVTGNHPILVAAGRLLDERPLPDELSPTESISPVSGRWVEARYLRKGDTLLSQDNLELKIDSVSIRMETTQVSFLAISGPHTYAVEGSGIVVHNGGSKEAAEEKGALYESTQDTNTREIVSSGGVTVFLPTDNQSERIRLYSGACNLVIESIEEVKREISDMAENVGGYVEQSSDRGIVIRLPAAVFRMVFNDILDLGEVLHKAIETYDVTDQYTDPEGRMIVAIKARDRLYELLKKVEDVKERLEILKKIREYTETIERLELSFQVLEQRVAMSRITVDLKPRLEETVIIDKPIPFKWIDQLRPLYVSTSDLPENVTITLPDDVALFQKEGVMRAEAADGTRIRIGSEVNNPLGDSMF